MPDGLDLQSDELAYLSIAQTNAYVFIQSDRRIIKIGTGANGSARRIYNQAEVLNHQGAHPSIGFVNSRLLRRFSTDELGTFDELSSMTLQPITRISEPTKNSKIGDGNSLIFFDGSRVGTLSQTPNGKLLMTKHTILSLYPSGSYLEAFSLAKNELAAETSLPIESFEQSAWQLGCPEWDTKSGVHSIELELVKQVCVAPTFGLALQADGSVWVKSKSKVFGLETSSVIWVKLASLPSSKFICLSPSMALLGFIGVTLDGSVYAIGDVVQSTPNTRSLDSKRGSTFRLVFKGDAQKALYAHPGIDSILILLADGTVISVADNGVNETPLAKTNAVLPRLPAPDLSRLGLEVSAPRNRGL